MRGFLLFSSLAGLIFAALSAPAGQPSCIPFSDAGKYIGSHRCVRGKVVQVVRGDSGVHFVDFCEDHTGCPFSVVIFANDLRHVGDIRELDGKEIEIQGDIKEYDGHAEIILERVGQLHGEAGRIPPLPKEYDVERRGHYSAGKLSDPKTATSYKSKKASPSPNIPWDPQRPGGEPE